ncbi:MAG: YSC84-related protein [Gammaproteobacteria bacterium]|nr:YSC84-related protein [Gammaproteobacteria bacterium]
MSRPTVSFTLAVLLVCQSSLAWSVSKIEIDARTTAAIDKLYSEEPAARELGSKAAGMLVFPRVYKLGMGLGGEYGEGALMINGQPAQYYRITAASFGFQLGGQAKAEVVMFMTEDALQKFRDSDGWEAGVDGSVAIVQFGVGKEFDTHNVKDPIIGFVFGNKGLMYDLSLEGSKFWKIQK